MNAFSNPAEIATTGQRIYDERYRAEFERKHAGRFVAIDVSDGQAYVAERPEEAVQSGRKASPKGLFHLIRVGSSGAFRLSYSSDDRSNRLL